MAPRTSFVAKSPKELAITQENRLKEKTGRSKKGGMNHSEDEQELPLETNSGDF
ncbi:hypothetical protein TIFTF001_033409 [Ficus carica]|uniref:Uncharacterized protein n=1 Tax=Ficus carica TaxID=3494 RepID=A0AA88DY65_FICCA|nr:hypothetical protein TIFTF001_033409 [Ficus carica]